MKRTRSRAPASGKELKSLSASERQTIARAQRRGGSGPKGLTLVDNVVAGKRTKPKPKPKR